jgi:hypothetical protein
MDSVGAVDVLLDVKIEYATCLLSIYSEILEDRWPSQYMIDVVMTYATILRFPAVEINRLLTVLLN